jgi:alpha,alpha-trehalose phosphorylase
MSADDPGPYDVEPWAVRERELHLDALATSESVFALSNGHIGLRGNLDEGEPAGVPGTYLAGFYETHALPYAEGGYGYPEDGQSIINVTNGKVIRLLVDDEPFDIRYGDLLRHERCLDLRDGILRRTVEWRSPTGQAVRVHSRRLVSFTQRAIAAIVFEVEPADGTTRIVVQSELVANEPVPEKRKDPRVAVALDRPLIGEHHGHHELRAGMVHRTRASGLRMAAGMDHLIEGPEGTVTATESEPDLARVTISTELERGQKLRIVKFLAYGWSSQRPLPALRDQVDAALASAKRTGWDGLCRSQREYLDDFWDRADVEVEGDAALQQALRFAAYHVLQAGARAEGRAIPAKGLTGRGYDGHTFWDQETYVLPMLTYIAPDAAGDVLRWRHSTLGLAMARAQELGLEGASFPWRTIRGQECSGYWPAGTAAFHINADIADAVRRYLVATGDEAFEAGPGLELLVATARLWASLGHHDRHGEFRIDGVTGPDEYSALVDNNVYTNLMAARNLRQAAEVATRYADEASDLGVTQEETARWRDAAEHMRVPYDEDLRVHPAFDGFTKLRQWTFREDAEYPLLLHVPYYTLYSSQIVKQADLVFALFLCGENFTAEEKARDFAFYEALTVRDSSLSAAVQGTVAAETGHLELAYAYLGETALIDLHDLAGNTAEGLHIAALAGAWTVAVAGFGGMRDHGDVLYFAPRLPSRLVRLNFRLVHRGRRLSVDVRPGEATYSLSDGQPLEICHHGDPLTVTTEAPVTRDIPPPPDVTPVRQPPGREPRRPV